MIEKYKIEITGEIIYIEMSKMIKSPTLHKFFKVLFVEIFYLNKF